MKKTIVYFITVIVTIFGQVNAQSDVQDNVTATNAIDAFVNYTVSPGYLLYGIPVSSGEIVGNAYLNDTWKKAILKLAGQDKEFNIQECKINLYSNQIEINFKNSIKAIDGSKVEKFILGDLDTSAQGFYKNANTYKVDGAPQVGFLEVLVDGSTPLVKKTVVIIKRPDYNIQLNVGNKNTRIIKEEVLYFAKGDELINIKTIKNKKFPLIFGNAASVMSKFIEDNSLRLSTEEDLTLIFKHYNQEVVKK
jgi:hypothetical protein